MQDLGHHKEKVVVDDKYIDPLYKEDACELPEGFRVRAPTEAPQMLPNIDVRNVICRKK